MVSLQTDKKNRLPLRWMALGVALGAALYWGPGMLGKGGAEHGGAPMAMPASVATVISKPITQWREFSGMVEAVHSAEIRPRVSGQIVAVHFKDGAEVKKGQPLFTIDPRSYEAERARARGALVAAESAYKLAAAELSRAAKLMKAKAISQSEFETKTSALSQASGALAAARGTLAVAEVNVEYTRVLAPISGKISRAEITVGNQVEAGPSAPLLASIVDLSPVYASFDVDEQTFLATIQGVPAAKLKTVPVQVGFSNDTGTPQAATIHSFDNQLKPGSGTIRVRALLQNADGTLVPGLFARVKLGSADAVPSILIHPNAVSTDQNKKFVLLVDSENKAQYREVTLGAMAEGLQVVTSGLADGDRIVVNGLQRLRPGAPVEVMPADMETLAPLAAPDAVQTPAEGAH